MKKRGSRFDFRIRMRQVAKSKRSMEMAIGTLVVIVLAVLVLIVLVLGFTIGWKALWNKITPYIGGSSGGANVDSVRNACELACNSASVSPSSMTEYCKEKKTIIFDKDNKESDTCYNLKSKIGLSCDVTCPIS